jgi:hypothetical protein
MDCHRTSPSSDSSIANPSSYLTPSASGHERPTSQASPDESLLENLNLGTRTCGPSLLHYAERARPSQNRLRNLPPDGTSELPVFNGMLLQPDTHPITQEQLVNEVRGIYAGLVIVHGAEVHRDRSPAVTIVE